MTAFSAQFSKPSAERKAAMIPFTIWGNHWEAGMDFIRIVAAILLPPLGVFLQVGIGKQFWINILLTLLGYIPGIVHAVWIIARR
jgi:uncharacterized membrane protein YqaE (UPF0057 family)